LRATHINIFKDKKHEHKHIRAHKDTHKHEDMNRLFKTRSC